jgi:HK97 gp10 family phage protein
MSVEMELQVEGSEELAEQMRKVDRAVYERVQRRLYEIGINMRTLARQLAPVRTGRLRDSIFSRVQGWELKFGATVSYAAFQEFGTSRVQPKRFLSQAVEQYDSQLEVLLAAAVEEAVRETST